MGGFEPCAPGRTGYLQALLDGGHGLGRAQPYDVTFDPCDVGHVSSEGHSCVFFVLQLVPH